MLDKKHENIGCTVSMLRMTAVLGDDDKLSEGLSGLFMEESKDCDFQMIIKDESICVFDASAGPSLYCCIGECPLGELVNKQQQSNRGTFGQDSEEYLIGTDMACGTRRGNIHIGYTGWRKWWDNVKRFCRCQWFIIKEWASLHA